MRTWLIGSLVGSALLTVGGCITDCTVGSTTAPAISSITDKTHIAAWTETQIISDGRGGTTINVVHHPDQYYIELWPHITASVSSGQYETYRIGENVVYTSRIGKWTKATYYTTIHGRPQ